LFARDRMLITRDDGWLPIQAVTVLVQGLNGPRIATDWLIY
jgi:hypothetical protein